MIMQKKFESKSVLQGASGVHVAGEQPDGIVIANEQKLSCVSDLFKRSQSELDGIRRSKLAYQARKRDNVRVSRELSSKALNVERKKDRLAKANIVEADDRFGYDREEFMYDFEDAKLQFPQCSINSRDRRRIRRSIQFKGEVLSEDESLTFLLELIKVMKVSQKVAKVVDIIANVLAACKLMFSAQSTLDRVCALKLCLASVPSSVYEVLFKRFFEASSALFINTKKHFKAEGLFNIIPDEITKPSEFFSYLSANLENILTSEFALFFKDVCITLVSWHLFNFVPSQGILDLFSISRKELKGLTGVALVLSTLKTLKSLFFFIEMIIAGKITKSYFTHEDPLKVAIRTAPVLIKQSANLSVGLPVEGCVDMSLWFHQASECYAVLDAKSANTTVFQSRGTEILSLKLELGRCITGVKSRMASARRVPPLGVAIIGHPGIGKSGLVDTTFAIMSKIKKIEHHPGLIFHRNMSSKFMDAYQPLSQPYFHYSEMGKFSDSYTSAQPDEAMEEMLSVLDSQSMEVNKAKAEDKGKDFVAPILVVLDSNNPTLGINKKKFFAVAAFARRFIYVVVTVKPAFRKMNGLSCEIDGEKASKVPMFECYEFTVYTQWAKDNNNAEPHYHLQNGDIHEYYDVMVSLFYQHLQVKSEYEKQLAEVLRTLPFGSNREIPDIDYLEESNVWEIAQEPIEEPPSEDVKIEDNVFARVDLPFFELVDGDGVILQQAFHKSMIPHFDSYPDYNHPWIKYNKQTASDNGYKTISDGSLFRLYDSHGNLIRTAKEKRFIPGFDKMRVSAYSAEMQSYSMHRGMDADLKARNDAIMAERARAALEDKEQDCDNETFVTEEDRQMFLTEEERKTFEAWRNQGDAVNERRFKVLTPEEIMLQVRTLNEERARMSHNLMVDLRNVGEFLGKALWRPVDRVVGGVEHYTKSVTDVFSLLGRLSVLGCSMIQYWFIFQMTKKRVSQMLFILQMISLLLRVMFFASFFLISSYLELFFVSVLFIVIYRELSYREDQLKKSLSNCKFDFEDIQWKFTETCKLLGGLLGFGSREEVEAVQNSSYRTFSYISFAITTGLGAYGIYRVIKYATKKVVTPKKKKDPSYAEGNNCSTGQYPVIPGTLHHGGQLHQIPINGVIDVWNVMKPVVGVACATGVESLVKAITRNVRYVKLFGGEGDRLIASSFMVGIKGDCAIMNTHVVNVEMCEYLIVMVPNDATRPEGGFRSSKVYRKDFIEVAPEITLLKLGSMFSFKDITMHIPEDVLEFDTIVKAYIGDTPTECEVVTDEVYRCEDKEFVMPKCFSYPWKEHGVGKCGTPLLVSMGKMACFAGIHFAGGDGVGLSARISRKMLRPYLESNERINIASEEYSFTAVPSVHAKSPFKYEEQNMLFLGSETGNVMIPKKSDLVKTEIHDAIPVIFEPYFGEYKEAYGPPVFNPYVNKWGDWISPYNKALRKMSLQRIPLDPILADRVRKRYVIHILDGIGDKSLHPYDVKHAINGDPKNPNFRRMNASTAPGFGWKGVKGDHIPIVDENDPFWQVLRLPTKELEAELDNLFQHWKDGTKWSIPYKVALKDEARPIEKVQSGSTRLFYIQAIQMVLAMRMLYGSYFSLFPSHQDVFCSAVGIDMFKGADAFWKKFLAFEGKAGDFDYEGFDVSSSPDIALLALECIHEILYAKGYPSEAKPFLDGCASEILVPVLSMCGEFFEVPGLQPSGMYATAELNSTKNTLMLMCCWYDTPGLCDLDFFEHMYHVTYGDDIIYKVSPKASKYFNNNVFRVWLKNNLNMTVTTATKSKNMPDFSEEKDISFLKRTFVYREDLGRYVGQLDIKSLYKTLMWTIPSKEVPPSDQMLSSIRSVCYELFLHLDEKQYNDIRSQIIAVFSERYTHGRVLDSVIKGVPTWDELVVAINS